jgi:GH24 family phage-related lysozyme (muramidase)
MQHILDVQFPDENPKGAPGGDYQQISSNPSMFGATTARAEETFGTGLEKAGTQAIDAATEQQENQNKVRLVDRKSSFADKLSDMHADMMSLEGHAALSAYPDYKQKSAQLLKDTVDSVDGPKQKAMLGEALTTIQDSYWKVWGGHAAGQEKMYQTKVAGDAIASNSARASNLLVGGDEQGADRALREQDAEVHNWYEGQGFDRDASEVEAQKRRGITLKTAIETVAAGGDVGKAQSLFDKYRDRMDPTSVLQVTANLKSGKAQLDGRNLADEESGHAQPNADTVAGVPSSFVAQVKRSEGFAPQAKWDVKQFSSGYGTKANFEGEQITKEEADRRFNVEFSKAARIVDGVNPNLDPGTKAALTSLTYNAGADWVNSGLGAAIRAGDLDKAKQAFLQYNKAGGETNEGLANRRYREAQWFGSAEAPPSNGPLVDKQTAYERVLARTDSNPLLQTAAMARLNQVYGIYHAEQTAQHASFDQKLADSQAEAMATGTARAPLMEPDFVNRYGATEGQRQYGEYQKNLALGSDIAGLSTMSPDEQSAVLARHTPQPGSEGFEAEQTRQQAVAKAVQHSNKERDDDPAAFALRRLPAAQSAYADFNKVVDDKDAAPADKTAAAARFANVTLSEQARVGVQPQQRAILTRGQVASIGGAINAAATSDDPEARQRVIPLIKQQAEMWGNSWPQVAQQILPNAAPIVKVIAAGGDPDAMLRVLSIPKGEKPVTILKEQNEVSARNMTSALNVAMAPFKSSMVGLQRDRDYDGYFNVAQELAALYVGKDGKGAEEAAQSAFNAVVGNRYTFADTYRIPKSLAIDASAVQRGAYEARQAILRGKDDPASPFHDIQLQVNDIGVSDNEADSRRNYSRNGVFVTSPKNDGLNIAYNRTFVKGAGGQPILLTWDQLQKLGGTKEAAQADAGRAMLGSEQSP